MSLTPTLFHSSKPDGGDTTKLRPTDWNNVVSLLERVLDGADAHGSIAYRDTSSINGLTYLPDVAVGSVLVSGGVGVAPAFSASPSLTGVTLANGVTQSQSAELMVVTALTMNPFTSGKKPFGIQLSSNQFSGVYDQFGVIGFNTDAYDGMSGTPNAEPSWLMGMENDFYDGVNHTMEWYVNYQSPDGSTVTNFRPYYVSVLRNNNASHKAQLILDIGDATGDFNLMANAVSGVPMLAVTSADITTKVPFTHWNNLRFANAGVDHGITDYLPTNDWGAIQPFSSSAGGLDLIGISDTDSLALRLTGIIGSTDPTDTVPAVKFDARKKGAGILSAALANAETAFSFNNANTPLLTILGAANVGIGSTTFGTSAARVLGIGNGTEPSTSPADMVQLYSVDLSAGNATLGLRTETAVVSESVTSDRTLSVRINGTTYKLCLKA
jgi:hypothetical protein